MLNNAPRQVSNMDNKIIVKSGQRKKPEEFANNVPTLVPQANHIRTGFLLQDTVYNKVFDKCP